VDIAKLDTVRKRLRYGGVEHGQQRHDRADLSYYVALKRTPETMNALYDQFATLTGGSAAGSVEIPGGEGRTIVTLTGRECEMRIVQGLQSGPRGTRQGAVAGD